MKWLPWILGTVILLLIGSCALVAIPEQQRKQEATNKWCSDRGWQMHKLRKNGYWCIDNTGRLVKPFSTSTFNERFHFSRMAD